MAIDLGDMPKGTPPTPQQQAQIRSSIGLGTSGNAGFSSLVLTGQSITGTAANSLLDMTTTWNTSGIPSAIKLNVNDVASNAASNLLDLQVGGISRFKVDKTGKITSNTLQLGDANLASPAYTNISNTGVISFSGAGTGIYEQVFILPSSGGYFRRDGANVLNNVAGEQGNQYILNGSGLKVGSASYLGWTSGTAISTNVDTFLHRDVAGIIAQRNGVNAQAFRVYNTFPGTGNNEYAEIAWSGNIFNVRPAASGSGSIRDSVFGSLSSNTYIDANIMYFRTSSSARWAINSTGSFLAVADNNYDIGASGGNRPRNIYAASNILANGSYYTIRDGAIQWATSNADPASGIQLLIRSSPSMVNALCIGGATSAFPAIKRNGAGIDIKLADDSAYANLGANAIILDDTFAIKGIPTTGWIEIGGKANVLTPNTSKIAFWESLLGLVQLANNGSFSWSSLSYAANGNGDLALFRDAAGTLAQRNAGNAQTFRIYNTYTDATTFERLNLKWDTNVLKIGTEKGSVGGTGRALKLEAGTGFLNFDYDGPITLQGAGSLNPVYIQASGDSSVHLKSSGNQPVYLDSANSHTSIIRSQGSSISDRTILILGQTSGSQITASSKTNSVLDTEFSILGNSAYLRKIIFGGAIVAPGNIGTDVHIKSGLHGTSTVRCGDVYLYGMSSLGSGRSGNVILQNDSSVATNGNVGIGNIAPLSKLDISDTWNSNISVTGASGTGTVATITFAAQTTAIAVGSTIVVASVNPAGYNGTFVVTASSLISVSYANATTAAWISGGNIQQLFTAVKLNVADTASNASSLLMDLQVGGATRFKINKLGQLDATSGDIVVGGYFGANRGFYVKDILSNNQVSFRISYYGSSFYGPVGITGADSGGPDVIWMRDAAGILAQRNGLNAQTFRLYNTYTDATTFERLNLKWDTNVLKLGTEKGSVGGAARAMEFQTDGATRMTVTSAGNVGIGTTSPLYTLDVNGAIGTSYNGIILGASVYSIDVSVANSISYKSSLNHIFSGASTELMRLVYPGNLGLGNNAPTAKLDIVDIALAGSGALSGSILNLAQTWNTTGTPTAIKLNVTDTASNANSLLMDLQVGSVSRYSFGKTTLALPPIVNSGFSWAGVSAQNQPCSITRASDDSLAITASLGSGKYISIGGNGYGLSIFSSQIILNTNLRNVYLSNDDNHILAQRNAANAQTFRLYNTYTDATTFERLNLKWDTNVLKIGTEKGSVGGAARAMEFQTDGATRMTVNTAGNVGIGVSGASTGGEILYISNVFSSDNTSYLRIDNTNSNGSIGVRLGSTNAKADFYYDNITTQTYLRGNGSALNIGTFSGNSNSYLSLITFQQERMRITGAGNVGIGTITPAEKLDVVGNVKVSGHFSAATKSFLIPHPTKPAKQLQYACLEGPENGVYIRGKTNESIILLPEYWRELVDEDSVTVTLTQIGKPQQLFVAAQNSESVEVGNVDGFYNYVIYGERKDVDKLQTEI